MSYVAIDTLHYQFTVWARGFFAYESRNAYADAPYLMCA
jgi:hypothetical protein